MTTPEAITEIKTYRHFAATGSIRAEAEMVLLAEIEALRGALVEARGYIAGVNADCPKGSDGDRDDLLEKLDAHIERTKP